MANGMLGLVGRPSVNRRLIGLNLRQPLQFFSCAGFSNTTAKLPNQDVKFYRRNGFVRSRFELLPSQLTTGQRAMETLLKKNQHVLPEQLVNSHLEDGEGEAQNVKGCREFLELASDPALVEVVAQLLGTENVILWACQVFCKLPFEGKAVPFHQDGQYWPIEPLRACTAWIALDRSDAENGGLQVLPGSHKKGYFKHVQNVDEESCINFIADPKLVKPLLPEAKALELGPGQISFHDSMLLHGSRRNQSERRRAGVAAVYMPGECHFNRMVEPIGSKLGGLNLDFSKRPLFIVKGSNQHTGNTLLRNL